MTNITKEFYENNRQRLSEKLPNTLIVLTAHKLLQYSYDTPYGFRQESNFLYLTGLNEPDMTLIIDTNSGETTLLIEDKNEYQKDWDGDITTKEIGAISGINNINSNLKLKTLVGSAVKKDMKIGLLSPPPDRIEPYGFYANPARKILYDEIKKYQNSFIDIRKYLASLRQIKTINEINEIKQAIEVTGKSLETIKKNINDYSSEKEIEKELTINFLQNAGDKHGFDPIVASGKNASTIHYKQNNNKITKNSLLLLDVGAQVGHYSADISRTYEVGSPQKRQSDILKAVLDVQQKVIEAVKPGITLKQLQELTDKELSKHYDTLNISKRKLPHGVSHHLGLDVHDLADYQAVLEENMVITVEPGIYLSDEGIGVRIEDDILITKNGSTNLSSYISY